MGMSGKWKLSRNEHIKQNCCLYLKPEVGQTDIRAPKESELPCLFMTEEIQETNPRIGSNPVNKNVVALFI